MEPFWSHLVRPIFSDVVTILGCSYLRCIDSRIIISVKYRSALLYVPIESFSSYQGRQSGMSFEPFNCGNDCFLRGLLQPTLLGREMFIHVEGYSLDDIRRDEPSVEHDLKGLTALLSVTL